jgi:hypothetical protein
MGKKVALVKSDVISRQLLGGNEENYGKPQVCRSLGRDLNTVIMMQEC